MEAELRKNLLRLTCCAWEAGSRRQGHRSMDQAEVWEGRQAPRTQFCAASEAKTGARQKTPGGEKEWEAWDIF